MDTAAPATAAPATEPTTTTASSVPVTEEPTSIPPTTTDSTAAAAPAAAAANNNNSLSVPGADLPDLVKIRTALAAEEAKTGKKLTPFLTPPASSRSPATPALTAEQEAKYASLLTYAQSLTTLPTSTAKDAPSTPLAPREQMWLTRECLLRYLRATKWDVATAQKRLESTLIWRREYGVDGFRYKHGRQSISYPRITCFPVSFSGAMNSAVNPSKQNTERTDRQINHLVWMLELVLELAPAGQESLALLVDFKSSSTSSNPSMTQAKQVLNILQNHYPERLGRALVINVPWFVWGFFKLINPFIDPLTKEKLKFNENLREHVPPEQLLKGFGGDCNFEYDHAKYWPELTRLGKEKNDDYTKRWEALGSPIGASEFVLKGGKVDEVEKLVGETEKLAV